jgi:formate hydrogenlyase subunit 3/multisubunit Na+/H+ antiporter MnhD subunit
MQLEAIMLYVAMFLVSLIVNALLLGVVLGWTKGENREFGDTIVTAIIMAIVGLIPIIGCIIQWYIIKTRHEQTWGGAIATWIVLIIVYYIILAIVAILFLGGLMMLMPIPMP